MIGTQTPAAFLGGHAFKTGVVFLGKIFVATHWRSTSMPRRRSSLSTRWSQPAGCGMLRIRKVGPVVKAYRWAINPALWRTSWRELRKCEFRLSSISAVSAILRSSLNSINSTRRPVWKKAFR